MATWRRTSNDEVIQTSDGVAVPPSLPDDIPLAIAEDESEIDGGCVSFGRCTAAVGAVVSPPPPAAEAHDGVKGWKEGKRR